MKLNSKKLQARYTILFERHLLKFLHEIFEASSGDRGMMNSSHALAVSGGVDSMALLFFAYKIKNELGRLRVLFVNHGTRVEQDEDSKLVKRFCDHLKISFQELRLRGLDKNIGNFEARARILRREALLKEMSDKEFLWTGHHLDDSFEWSLMQKFRSSQLKSSLGIPVRNKNIIRPFMAVSRAQIEKYVNFNEIPFREDPTNVDERFDRNFLRHQMTPLIRGRYPKYLKFYAHQANDLSKLLGVHISCKNVQKSKSMNSVFLVKDLNSFSHGALLEGPDFLVEDIREVIHTLSYHHRGELITPIKKMLMAIKNSKKGPFYFSGGVLAYYCSGQILFYDREAQSKRSEIDRIIASNIRQLGKERILEFPCLSRIDLDESWQRLLERPDVVENLPSLVLILENKYLCKTFNAGVYDILFPEVSKVCRELGLKFVPLKKCLNVWAKKEQKLPTKMKLVPLYHLSHLFTSQ